MYIPHANCIVSVYSAGKNLSVLAGAVIGRKRAGERQNTNVTFGDNVIVAANSFVFGGIKIGDNVVIGAGSVVFRDIPANCCVAGNPAKVIKEYEFHSGE